MQLKPRKLRRNAIKRKIAGYKFLEMLKRSERVDSLELEEFIKKEAKQKQSFREQHGDKAFYFGLTIAGIVKIIRSLNLPESKKMRIRQLEARALTLHDYLTELKRVGEKKLTKKQHQELIALYCELLQRKLTRDWNALGKVRRNQIKNELRDYKEYLQKYSNMELYLDLGLVDFLEKTIRLIDGEIYYLLGHEGKYYLEARQKLGQIIEDMRKAEAK